jgi:hypothetical protein
MLYAPHPRPETTSIKDNHGTACLASDAVTVQGSAHSDH